MGDKFTKMSMYRCHCGTFIKQSVVDRKPKEPFFDCFKCFRKKEASRGHDMSTAREVRQGLRPARKHVVFTKEEWARMNKKGGKS